MAPGWPASHPDQPASQASSLTSQPSRPASQQIICELLRQWRLKQTCWVEPWGHFVDFSLSEMPCQLFVFVCSDCTRILWLISRCHKGPYREGPIGPKPNSPLQNLPTNFRIYPPPSEFTHHLQKKICFEASGPFWTFFLKSQDPKNVDFVKNDFLKEHYELPGRPWA